MDPVELFPNWSIAPPQRFLLHWVFLDAAAVERSHHPSALVKVVKAFLQDNRLDLGVVLFWLTSVESFDCLGVLSNTALFL
jgi:hypothetical protein